MTYKSLQQNVGPEEGWSCLISTTREKKSSKLTREPCHSMRVLEKNILTTCDKCLSRKNVLMFDKQAPEANVSLSRECLDVQRGDPSEECPGLLPQACLLGTQFDFSKQWIEGRGILGDFLCPLQLLAHLIHKWWHCTYSTNVTQTLHRSCKANMLTYTNAYTLSPSFSLSLSLKHTHTQICMHTHTHMHKHIHTQHSQSSNVKY